MPKGFQGLINEVVGYGMGAMLNRALGILIACVYPILLNRDEYGRLDVIFSVPTLLAILFLIGLDSTLARFFYEGSDKTQRNRLVSTVFYTVIGITIPLVGILLVASRPIALWLYNDPRYVLYLRLVLVAMPFLLASRIQMALFRFERRVHIYNLIVTFNLLLSALVGIATILIFHIGVAGILIGFLIGHAGTVIIGILTSRSYLTELPMVRNLPELLGFGLPLMFSGVAFWFIGYVNRPMLAHQVSADDLGLFAIASGGVNVMALLLGSFRNAWQPYAFSIMGDENAGRVYGRTLTLFTFLGATIAVCGTLFAPQALLFINLYTRKNWSGAASCVGPLAMGILLNAMYFVVQTGIYIARRTSVIAWTVGAAALSTLVFNSVLIPRFGIIGAAVATALGHLTALLLLYFLAQRIEPVPYQPGKLAFTLLLASIVMTLDFHFQTHKLASDLLIKIALLLSYGTLLLSVRIITLNDLRLIWNGIRSALGSIRNRVEADTEEVHANRN